MKHTRHWINQIILTLALALLVSCGNATPSQETGNSATPTAQTTQTATTSTPRPKARTATPTPLPTSAINVKPDQLNGVTLQFWLNWDGSAGETITRLIDRFNQENEWKIKVDATRFDGLDTLNDEVTNAINTTGKIPDIATGYVYKAQNWNTIRDIVLDLNTYVNDPDWGIDATDIEDFYPEFWESEVISDTRWGLPAWRSGKVLYYNQTWGKELGFSSPPTTPEQFAKQACAASKALQQDDIDENDGKGGWLVSTDFSTTLGWMYAFGSNPTKSEKNQYYFNTPEVTKTFQFLKTLFDDGCAWVPDSQLPAFEFASRQGLFMAGSIIDIPQVERNFTQVGNMDKWIAIPFPSPKGQPSVDVFGPSLVVFKSTPTQELGAWLFARWLLDTQNQVQLVQAGNTFPLSQSVRQSLENDSSTDQPWLASFDLITYAKNEPNLATWEMARWAVGDASRQLYQWYFEADQIPSLVKLLNDTTNKLHVTTK